MKLPKSEIVVETGGAGIEAEFGIENIGFILKLLRDKMYTNPIKAICREISCNARDAHREVGKRDLPVEIHLPCLLDSTYRIKDFGPGISPDRMQKVFILYGNSTKNEDNVQTGGFGLGAKTPFAYTDQFSIITTTPEIWGGYECPKCNRKWVRQNTISVGCPVCQSELLYTPETVHVKRNYIAYIDETERGKMREVSAEVTDESCGTEIVIQVKNEDWKRFAEDTVSVTQYWRVRPNLTGKTPAPQYPTDENETLLEGEGWRLPKRDRYCYGIHSKAIVDGISYAIESDLFDDHEDSGLLRKGLLFNFGVGVLTLTPQRENLQYDSNTREQIKARLEEVRKTVAKVIEDRISTAKNYREAVGVYKEVKNIFSGAMPKDFSPVWNGTPCHSTRIDLKIPSTPNYHDPDNKLIKGVRLFVFENKENKNGDVLVYSDQTKYLDISDDSQVFVNDLGVSRMPRARIRNYIEQNEKVKYVQLLTFDEGIDTETGLDLCKKANSLKIDLRLLGINQLSSMPEAPKEVKAKEGAAARPGRGRGKRRETFDAYKFDTSYHDVRREVDKRWRPCEIEKEGGSGVYVILENYKRDITSGKMKIDRVWLSKVQDVLSLELYGVREKDVAQLGPDMIPFETAIKNAVNQRIASLGYNLSEIREAEAVIQKTSMNNVFGHYVWKEAIEKNMHRIEDQGNSLLYQCWAEYNKYLSVYEKAKTTIWIADQVYPPSGQVEIDISSLLALRKSVTERYPLLSRVDGWRFGTKEIDSMFEYINLIDNKYAEMEPLAATA